MDTLTIVFLMGLLGGVHCLSMCGGVVALLTSA
ncbi:MAG TPA: sulfite exporter TauE/SafE family protein, partial [Gammaproteobacteria bacterium]|nr:sulfite exporter TauE/SafE family protein [Gammaproteobacteria bacterium]HBA24819.1 sulfite exporter TauE/SafE family protein [Gammaproteobacteria bacterium]